MTDADENWIVVAVAVAVLTGYGVIHEHVMADEVQTSITGRGTKIKSSNSCT